MTATGGSTVEAKLVSQIIRIDDAHKIPRSVLFQFSASEALRRHLRIVPERKGDQRIGIRLFGVRTGGVLAALGFEETSLRLATVAEVRAAPH